MNPEESEEWKKLSRALFGAKRTSDEAFFVQKVMRDVRRLSQPFPDLLWPRFLRWAVPVLGLSLAGFLLALRSPVALQRPSTETLLSAPETPGTDFLSDLLGGSR